MCVFSKRLRVQTRNNLKTAWELIKFIWTSSMCAPLVTLQMQRDIGIIPTYAATVTHRSWLWPVKFGLEAPEGTVTSQVGIPGLSHISIGRSRMEWGLEIWGAKGSVLLVLSEPFDTDQSTTRGCHVIINVTDEKLMSFLAVFKLIHVYICNRFKNTPIYYHPYHL
jgi:hypothetical protein